MLKNFQSTSLTGYLTWDQNSSLKKFLLPKLPQAGTSMQEDTTYFDLPAEIFEKLFDPKIQDEPVESD